MKQQTLVGFERYGKTTRRAQFLADMHLIVPWAELAAVGVHPDRRSSAVCGGSFLAMTPKSRTSARLPRNPVPSRHITNRGELDGAKDTDGG